MSAYSEKEEFWKTERCSQKSQKYYLRGRYTSAVSEGEVGHKENFI
jgi:hypothetical protein